MTKFQGRLFWFALGLIVFTFGLVFLLYPEISYKGAESIEIGPVVIERPKHRIIYIPQIFSLFLIGLSLVITIIFGLRKR